MASDVKDQTVYIQDILPQNIKDLLKEPNYDVDKILLHQIKAVSNCKKDLVHRRKELLLSIENEYSDNDYKSCGPFDGEFLTSVLKDVEKDEAEARRKVLGEQESVEMFKSALAADAVSEDYLTSARSYRDTMTRQLRDVVEGREILLVALEVLRRSPMAYIPQHNPKMESLGLAFSEAKQSHNSESETLKKLTEWKKNPEMYITDDDEFFAFFNEGNSEDPENEESPEEVDQTAEESKLSSALAMSEAETQKLIHFKSTKVDSVDREFDMLADVAADILKHELTIKDTLTYIQKACEHNLSSDSVGIEKYIIYLRLKYRKLKFKLSTKGYNFSLKVMRKTKSVVSLTLLSTLLDASQDLPEEVLEAQEKFSYLSNAVKRICSMYGRCVMAFQTVLKKEKDLEGIIQDAPKVNYAGSLRISDNFASNMKELKRVNELKDEIKKMADSVLKEVIQIAG